MNNSRLNSILNWSVRVGTLFGIPINLHITIIFFLLPALAGLHGGTFWYQVEFAVAIVLSILLHELGHGLTAKYFKQTGLSIMLHGFGGFASSQGSRTPRQELIIVLAGPAVTFAVGLTCLLVGASGLHAATFGSSAQIQFSLLHYVGSFNILLGFLNLIPSLPFDGGLALAAILWFRIPHGKALRLVGHIGLVIGPILTITGFLRDDRILMVFGLMSAFSSYVYLAQTGGIRFREFTDDRRARLEEEAFKKRSRAKNDAYLDEVTARAKEREEQERLRRLLE